MCGGFARARWCLCWPLVAYQMTHMAVMLGMPTMAVTLDPNNWLQSRLLMLVVGRIFGSFTEGEGVNTSTTGIVATTLFLLFLWWHGGGYDCVTHFIILRQPSSFCCFLASHFLHPLPMPVASALPLTSLSPLTLTHNASLPTLFLLFSPIFWPVSYPLNSFISVSLLLLNFI